MELKVPDGGPTGYASNIAKDVVLKLRKYGIQARPIGNVLYLMASPTTPRESCDRMLRAVVEEMIKPWRFVENMCAQGREEEEKKKKKNGSRSRSRSSD